MNSSDAKSTAQLRAPRASRHADRSLDPKQAAEYIADMALELRNLAKANGLSTLQGLLEVAYYEAFGVSAQHQLPAGELERLAEMRRAAAG